MTGQLRYDLVGQGGDRTVVLLHSLAMDGTIWRDFAPLLGPGVTVLAPDLPGHGPAPYGDPSSVESMADGVAELLRTLGMRDVTLIGMSLGGSVAQALTIRHGDLVGRLGLVDTTAWYGEDAPAAWAARAGQARERGLSSLAGFQLERWFTDGFRGSHGELCERLLEIFRRNDLDNYVASCTALGAMDLRERLERIAVPTAVVVGELDQATPPPHAQALAKAISGADLTVIPGCKHLSCLERPDEVVAALRPILD
ncbi:alpha/beta fold hydrolase [Rugosimonospora acidiphila]|uniref:Alpha/beta fold hydrolase n=1 Tax=Rugosimonospora acidiphila TaxID=556531 RepID=A0ABP9S4K6_9ACTN